MRFRIVCLTLSLFALAPLFADQVVLTNGNTLSGAIVKKQGGNLIIKTDILGEISVPWNAIRSIEAKNATVIASGGEELTGPVTTEGNSLRVATASGPRTEPLTNVSDIRDPAEWQRIRHPSITQLWAGAISAQLALARGNAHTLTFTTGLTAARPTLHDNFALYLNQIYGTATVNGVSATVANAVRAGWAYDHNLSSRFTLGAFNDYDHDAFQSLDLRFVVGGTAGFDAVKTDTAVLTLRAGADYERESFSPNITRSSGELALGDDFTYKLASSTVVTQSFRVFPNMSDTGDYRLAFDLNAATKVKKWLSWQVTLSDRYLSNPVLGHKGNDILLSTGLSVSFAH